jgi:hypothetical protein
MFRRQRDKPPRPVSWCNVELGLTVDRHYVRRLPKLAAAVVKLSRHKRTLQRCQIFYARNIDMLLIAVLARALARSRALLVYEVLDVQRVFVGKGLVNRAFRWAERVLLGACDLLVVSSPDFMSRYFLPLQNYAGPWRLLENKVAAAQLPETEPPDRTPGPPWVIGWFGTLRCVRSLDILCRIAGRLGDRVAIHIRGVPSEEDLPERVIRDAAARHRNLLYAGPYVSPDDLPRIYGMVHFAWCVDYLDAGANSDWLLPNRLYEGCLMGALALARKDTATGRMVEQLKAGWAFAEPLETTVSDFLGSLDGVTYSRARRALASVDRSHFLDETDTRALLAFLDARIAPSGSTASG